MRRATCLTALALAAALAAGCASTHVEPPTAPAGPHDATSHHSFADVAHWTAVFDDPGRDAWQRPAALVQALGIRPGSVVVDLGAGTGYFSRYLSAAVGSTGTVLAVDSEPNLVVHLRQRAEREQSANLVPILASADNPRLLPGAADLVLVVDTYHHVDDRITYFRSLRRCLTRGGRVTVVDWQKRELPVGPPMDHKLAREQVVDEMEAAGYALTAEPDVLPYQYVLVFTQR